MTLRLVGSDTVHLTERTFMWIALTSFAIEDRQDDRALIGSVIATPGYAHDYASPFDGRATVTEPAVQDWADPAFRQLQALARTRHPLRQARHDLSRRRGPRSDHRLAAELTAPLSATAPSR